MLAKFDKSNGDLIDSVKYGRQDAWFNAENALGMTTDGTYLYVTGYTTVSPNNWDLFVAKFDKNLNEIWYSTWGGVANAESARSIVVAPDGSIYIGATTESFGNGEMEIVLIKYDPSGNMEWYKTWGGTLDDTVLDIHLQDDVIYLTGKTKSFHPTEKWEAVLLKVAIDSLVSDAKSSGSSELGLTLFPNPMTTTALVKFNQTSGQKHQLLIYSSVGKKVRTIDNISAGEVSIDKNGLEEGLYLFQLLRNYESVGVGKMIIQ